MNKMNKMMITLTDEDMTIKCYTTNKIKDYIKNRIMGKLKYMTAKGA